MQNKEITKERMAELEAVARQVLDELDAYGYIDERDGEYHCLMSVGYDFELSDESIGEILSAKEPDEHLSELIWSMEDDHSWCYVGVLAGEFRSILGKLGDFDGMEEDYIVECGMERIIYTLDYDFLEQDVLLNIMMDIEDANYDFSTVVVGPHIYAEELTDLEKYQNAGWYWLARQQGYDDAAILAALRNGEFGGSKFLETLYQEIENATTGMAGITFFVKTTLREAIALNKAINRAWRGSMYSGNERYDTGTVTIPNHATVGLVDTWNGSDGVLDIQLEKHVELPIRYIFNALPDGESGYSVKNIYGVCSSLWNTVIDVCLNYKQT